MNKIYVITYNQKYLVSSFDETMTLFFTENQKEEFVSKYRGLHVFPYIEDIKCYIAFPEEIADMDDFINDKSVPTTSKVKNNNNDYLIGQRVILNKSEIGTVVKPETGRTKGIWVFSPANGYASDYAFSSVEPLPNGQL